MFRNPVGEFRLSSGQTSRRPFQPSCEVLEQRLVLDATVMDVTESLAPNNHGSAASTSPSSGTTSTTAPSSVFIDVHQDVALVKKLTQQIEHLEKTLKQVLSPKILDALRTNSGLAREAEDLLRNYDARFRLLRNTVALLAQRDGTIDVRFIRARAQFNRVAERIDGRLDAAFTNIFHASLAPILPA